MEIIYVDSETTDRNINMSDYYKDNYNFIKQNKDKYIGFFIVIRNVIGVCVLLKGKDYIQIIKFNIDNTIMDILVKRFIEHIFMYIKRNNYNIIKVLNTNGLLSLERFIYGAEYINYKLCNSKLECMNKDELINIEKKNRENMKQHTYDKYQLIYFKNDKNICNLYCCL